MNKLPDHMDWDDALLMERYGADYIEGWNNCVSMFRAALSHAAGQEVVGALSRVVPEGNAVIPWRDEIDRMYVEGWAQSLRRIKDYRAYFIEHGYHPEYVAVRLERLLAAIAAQRKEGE